MSKFIFVSFADETKAYEGTRALEALHAEGSLTLYGMSVVAKGLDGKLSIQRESDHGPLGITVGALAGGLIGLLGGPIGAAIGFGGGALMGSFSDLSNLGVGKSFIEDVSKALTPGKVAVVAEITEEWVTPLNTRMQALGGVVHRNWRAVVEDDLSQKEMASIRAELSELKSEYEHAKADGKAGLKESISALEDLERSTADRLKSRIAELSYETEAKLNALQAQASRASGDLKTKIETRIVNLQSDGARRVRQLEQAWGLTKKALAS